MHVLENLANTISTTVAEADDIQRMKLHLAAVFCNNFVNHIYALMEEYCHKENLNFSLLIPLIQETALRLTTISPSSVQTGPATRADQGTIDKHLALLAPHQHLKDLYEMMTKSIQLHN